MAIIQYLSQYLLFMHLILLFIACVSASCNRIKLKITGSTEDVINVSTKVKIVFTSKNPFELILYTATGTPLQFKGLKASYVGIPTYYQINNLNNTSVKITMDVYEMDTDWIKISTLVTAIVTLFILIMYKRDYQLSQIFLIILMTIRLVQTQDYEKTAERIIHKILF